MNEGMSSGDDYNQYTISGLSIIFVVEVMIMIQYDIIAFSGGSVVMCTLRSGFNFSGHTGYVCTCGWMEG
jgi:hypothetical protein